MSSNALCFISHNFLDACRFLAVRQRTSLPAPVVPSRRSEDVSHLSSPLDSQQLRPPGCPIVRLTRRIRVTQNIPVLIKGHGLTMEDFFSHLFDTADFVPRRL